MSLMYHVTPGEDDKLRIRPVDAIASLHDACCEIQDMHLDSQVRQTLDIRGSALDLQMRFKRGSAHAIRISVLESADRREHTDIVLHMPTNHRPHIGYLTVDAASSSLSEDIQSRIPENTKFDLAEDELLNVRILIDKCMVEVFVNDRVVLMQMMYLDDLTDEQVQFTLRFANAMGTCAALQMDAGCPNIDSVKQMAASR